MKSSDGAKLKKSTKSTKSTGRKTPVPQTTHQDKAKEPFFKKYTTNNDSKRYSDCVSIKKPEAMTVSKYNTVHFEDQ